MLLFINNEEFLEWFTQLPDNLKRNFPFFYDNDLIIRTHPKAKNLLIKDIPPRKEKLDNP
jgi:hypothetical protein